MHYDVSILVLEANDTAVMMSARNLVLRIYDEATDKQEYKRDKGTYGFIAPQRPSLEATVGASPELMNFVTPEGGWARVRGVHAVPARHAWDSQS